MSSRKKRKLLSEALENVPISDIFEESSSSSSSAVSCKCVRREALFQEVLCKPHIDVANHGKKGDDANESDDDFQPVIPIKRKKAHASSGKEYLKDICTTYIDRLVNKRTGAVQHSMSETKPSTSASLSSAPKTKRQQKFEMANKKREAKHQAKKEAQQKKTEGKEVVCGSCGKAGHSRASNAACENHKPRRKTLTQLKRTSIIKTSLQNTCRNPDFVEAIRTAVKHVRDITYAGSLFANYYILRLLDQNKELPVISHDLCYGLFAIVAGKGDKASADIKDAFQEFKSEVHTFDPSYFVSQGYMTLIADAAKQYEECIRNHVVANFENKTIQYLLIRFSDKEDSAYLGKTTVSERKALARYAYTVATEDPSNEFKWPQSVPHSDERQKAMD
ncbi:hypothetical protein EC973_005094, partial [Apophysomyces ossiformis]